MVLTREGLEGGPIYALGPQLRTGKHRELRIDLRPDVASDILHARLRSFDAKVSITNRLKKMGLDAVGCALVREFAPNAKSPGELAAAIKGLTVPMIGLQGLDRAISSSGGVALNEVNENLMLREMPGVFVAGEMLDWDAPTGGYLLQACFSTGVAAARGASQWVR
jgi:predicted flavoprotein YhiN